MPETSGRGQFLNDRIEDIHSVTQDVFATFGRLNSQQLQWKAEKSRWSITQCLVHLIKTNSAYFPQFREIVEGSKKRSFWQRMPLLSGFWGRFLIRTVNPETRRKVKTFKVFMPADIDPGQNVLEDFRKHQERLSDIISEMRGVNLHHTIITSPASKFVTYSLHDCLLIITLHEQRHVSQAKEVMRQRGFGN